MFLFLSFALVLFLEQPLFASSSSSSSVDPSWSLGGRPGYSGSFPLISSPSRGHEHDSEGLSHSLRASVRHAVVALRPS
jgi:hypothetical protein